MKAVELRGDEYDRFSRIVFLNDRNRSDLSELKNWEQPLQYMNDSYVLHQTKGGPCGLFAVLDSHIVLKRNEQEDSNKEHLLISLILDIFKRVSTYSNTDNQNQETYVFCDGFDSNTKFIHFQYTNSYDEAYCFLMQSQYTDAFNACLMITISIIFASIGMNEFREIPTEPYIYGDKMTSMALVWLMLNGSTNTMNLQKTENGDYKGLTQNEIGIKVLVNPDKRVIGTWLNPNAHIFVCLRFFHFFVVSNYNDYLIVYDSMNTKSPFEGDKKRLNW